MIEIIIERATEGLNLGKQVRHFPEDDKGQKQALKFLQELAKTHTNKNVTETYVETLFRKRVKRTRYKGKDYFKVSITHVPDLVSE